MSNPSRLIEEDRKEELWKKHCGYLTLKRKEFRGIQTRLMLEQINILGSSKIGRTLMGEKIPASVEEFRQTAPLTTYDDYVEILKDKNEEGLPDKPYVWARTSGKSSALGPKWIPYTKAMYNRLSEPGTAAMIMSSCSRPGDVRLERNDKFLMASAPPPYLTGFISRSVQENLEVIFLPDLDDGEKMPYGERVASVGCAPLALQSVYECATFPPPNMVSCQDEPAGHHVPLSAGKSSNVVPFESEIFGYGPFGTTYLPGRALFTPRTVSTTPAPHSESNDE